VLDYLHRLRSEDGAAFESLKYLEQPTGRDILVHRHDWREVTRLKPVMLDEGLTDLELLDVALEQGWSGLALKTCKGHSFALAAAAWAHAHGMLLTMQDLTNPGISLIHSALFAANVPTINGVELNSPQFTPDANRIWLPRMIELFAPHDGVHRLADGQPVGLGSMQ
jgi:L-alanine-DL-glutamate epimerase-like enolase superfamily enzyme